MTISTPITPGIVYLLTNPAMPGLVKIGTTFRGSTASRLVELYTTGVPVPFECVYAAKVANAERVEDALHVAFAPNRINPKREFFEIEAGQAIAILQLLAIEDATPQIQKESEEIDEPSREAGAELRRRRPTLNFHEMGIPVGSTLECRKNGETAVVCSPRTVKFRDEETSLTRATRIVLGIAHSVAPSPYWSFNGRSLHEIYNETYRSED